MAVKSLIEIDLSDAKFVAFKKLHDQYTAALEKAPAQWSLVNAAIGQGEKAIQKQAGYMRQFSSEVGKVGRDFAKVATSVREITGSILRWGGIGGLLGGLLGIGSLFGIDALAEGAAGRRRRALGLGASFGGMQAFGGAFSRFVGEDFLERAAGGRFDISQRIGLMGAGLTSGQIDSGDTSSTGVALLRALKHIADTTDPRMLASVIQSRRLPTTIEELERLHKTGGPEFQRQLDLAARQEKELAIDDKLLEKWQNLVTTLDFSGKMINKTFVVGLANLADPLGLLSTAVTDVVKSFLEAAKGKGWIEGLAGALEKFAKYISTPKFDTDVKGFVDKVGRMADAAGKAAAWIASWFNHPVRGAHMSDRVTHAMQRRQSAKVNSAIGTGFNILTGGLFSWDTGPEHRRLQTITVAGKQVTVEAKEAERWQGFLGAMAAAGAPITALGGYNPRMIAGTDTWSEHAFGRAVDVDQSGRDKVTADFRAWVDAHKDFLQKTEKQYGIVGGESFKNPDLGHFEVAKGGYDTSKNVGITVQVPTGSNTIFSVNGMKGT